MCRLMSSTPTVGGGDSKKPVTPPSPSPGINRIIVTKLNWLVVNNTIFIILWLWYQPRDYVHGSLHSCGYSQCHFSTLLVDGWLLFPILFANGTAPRANGQFFKEIWHNNTTLSGLQGWLFLTDDGLHFFLGNCNKFLHLVPVVLLFTAQKQETTDKSTYKVKEYFSYNEYSFYDLENVIDSSGRRQIQPDPKQNYHHTDPWAKKEKSSA